MTWFQISIIANVVAFVIIGFLAVDRFYFRQACELRHNPIDKAIQEIKETINRIFERLDELANRKK